MSNNPYLKVKLLSPTAKCPLRATAGAAGYDLYADQGVVIEPGQRTLVSTGIAIQLPEGTEGQVRSRSGLAAKFGVVVLNSPGTIDEDYRSIVGVLLINHGAAPYEVKQGDRIAQLVIAKYENPFTLEVESLDNTHRGSGGFGSTGA